MKPTRNPSLGSVPPYTYMVREAVSSLPASTFEILLKHDDDRVELGLLGDTSERSSEIISGTQTRTYTTGQLLNVGTLKWLAMMNRYGFNIYFRPVGPHIVIDDLSSDFSIVAQYDGLSISLLIETSPRSFQAWITLARGRETVNPELADAAQRMLTKRYDGDAQAVGNARFGRLPGYYNRKPKHRRSDGSFPVVGIRNRGTVRVSRQTAEEASMLLSEERHFLRPYDVAAAAMKVGSVDHVEKRSKLNGDRLNEINVAQNGIQISSMSSIPVSEMWLAVPGKDRSARDWNVARWLQLEDVSYDESVRILVQNSEKARDRRDPIGYAELTVRRAWGI